MTAGLSRDELDEHGELYKLSSQTEQLRVVYSDVRLDNYLNQAHNRIYVPAPVGHRGLLWWRAQLAAYLLRPNGYINALLQKEFKALNWATYAGPLPPHPLPVFFLRVPVSKITLRMDGRPCGGRTCAPWRQEGATPACFIWLLFSFPPDFLALIPAP